MEISSLKPGEEFYDLGSGNGRVLIMAARNFGANVTGFELSFHHYLFSKINIFLHGCSKKAKVFWRNFYNEDLSGADAIFLWLTPRGNKKLEDKFEKELKTGARAMVYSSPLLFWKPEKIVEFPGHALLYFYVKK